MTVTSSTPNPGGTPAACCDKTLLSACCQPAAKAACCGSTAQPASCGCQPPTGTKR